MPDQRPSDPLSPAILLTPLQAARRLCVSHRTLERWRADGWGPPFIVLGRRSVRCIGRCRVLRLRPLRKRLPLRQRVAL